MLESLALLIPIAVFGVVILLALRIFINVPNYIASFLRRTWKIDPLAADFLGILGWAAMGFILAYFIAINLWFK